MNFSLILSAIILSVGLVGAGYWGEQAVVLAKKEDRFVTVKGLATKDVTANLGTWEIDYQEVGNDLNLLSDQLARDQSITIDFLLKNGFTKDEISLRPTKVTDQLANGYNPPSPQLTNNRYIIAGGVSIRSANVNQIQAVSQMGGDLIKLGVPLSANTPDPSYFYTKLDSIRPEMLASATQSAKLVALQFANDSGSKLGTIRRANQGVFELRSRDSSGNNQNNETGSINKSVRLVTTIDYYLVR